MWAITKEIDAKCKKKKESNCCKMWNITKVIVAKLDKIDENCCKGWKITKEIDAKGGG